jgi:hypothetical protein
VRSLRAVGIDGERLVLEAPNAESASWVADTWLHELAEALGHEPAIVFPDPERLQEAG